MRLNWFSTWILFLTLSYLEQSFSGEVKVISTHDEKGLLYSLCLYTNLPLTLPHSDVTVTKVYTKVCSYFWSVEFYYRNLGNFSIFPQPITVKDCEIHCELQMHDKSHKHTIQMWYPFLKLKEISKMPINERDSSMQCEDSGSHLSWVAMFFPCLYTGPRTGSMDSVAHLHLHLALHVIITLHTTT